MQRKLGQGNPRVSSAPQQMQNNLRRNPQMNLRLLKMQSIRFLLKTKFLLSMYCILEKRWKGAGPKRPKSDSKLTTKNRNFP